ncbi:hypothetical protein LEMLEM_LOCUS20345, partial [Lemmus lemmus]
MLCDLAVSLLGTPRGPYSNRDCSSMLTTALLLSLKGTGQVSSSVLASIPASQKRAPGVITNGCELPR